MTPFYPIKAILSHAPLAALLPAGFSALLASASSILLLGASAYLIASAALHPPLYTLALAITLVRACGIGRAVFRYLDRWLSHRAVFHAQEILQLRLYEKAAALLPLKEANLRQADFLHGLSDGCNALRDSYLRAFVPPILAGVLCLAGAIFLLPVSGRFPASLLPLLWFLHLLLPALLEKQEDSGPALRYRDLLLDAEEGRPELQNAGSLPLISGKLYSAARKFGSGQRETSRRKDQVNALLLLLRDFALIFFLFQLCLAVSSARISGIELAVYLLALQTVLAEIAPVADAWRMGRQGMKAAENILHIPVPADAVPTSGERPGSTSVPPSQPSPLLSVQGLGFSYRPGLPVLRDISFSLSAGEKMAIIGESGSGKTTLACLLMGFWPPEQGRIRLNGKDCRQLSDVEIRSFFAPCLQGEYVFSGSVRENFLRIHPGLPETSIRKALSEAQLEENILELPQGLDTPLGENGSMLSGGERQRFLIALALASPAPILLLDEPTAGLDKKTAHDLMDGILSHLNGRALLIITHDMVLAERMDKIYRIHFMEAS
ncbi:MAG: thiol reductant ABC exporter subunit CydC [Selenomonadaceae bacterium]|nr:thiol reductant ABC exporter subunit CydC [Selenomonadaceae bacterium]